MPVRHAAMKKAMLRCGIQDNGGTARARHYYAARRRGDCGTCYAAEPTAAAIRFARKQRRAPGNARYAAGAIFCAGGGDCRPAAGGRRVAARAAENSDVAHGEQRRSAASQPATARNVHAAVHQTSPIVYRSARLRATSTPQVCRNIGASRDAGMLGWRANARAAVRARAGACAAMNALQARRRCRQCRYMRACGARHAARRRSKAG